jgi:AcrR family transcriptional regulator
VAADGGLRERKKLVTRAALTAAALQLAVERGADHVTAEDIAEAADVSVRTFFNYFPTKEAAFVADDIERGRRFVALVTEAPADAPVWELLRRTAVTTFSATALPGREQTLKEQLVRTSPAVVAQVLGTFTQLEEELVVELARRTGQCSRLHARLLANSVIAAVTAAMSAWLDLPSDVDADAATYVALIDEAFAVLAPAFPPGRPCPMHA